MGKQKKQISEEFTDKLLDEYYFGDYPDAEKCKKVMKQRWKEYGYIKQTREEEIRIRLVELSDFVSKDKDEIIDFLSKDKDEIIKWFVEQVKLYRELIGILDNKLKEIK